MNQLTPELIDRILEKPGCSIKKLARTLLVWGLAIAVVLFVVGSLLFVQGVVEMADHKDDPLGEMLTCTYEEAEKRDAGAGYVGRVVVSDAVGLALASLCCLPLYGFGCVVEDVAAIKTGLAGGSKKTEQEKG